MNCPICNSETRVLAKEGDSRRRACTNAACNNRFSTVEVLKADHDHLQELVQDARALAEKLAA